MFCKTIPCLCRVCHETDRPYVGDTPNNGRCLVKLRSTDKNIKSYDGVFYNCVQASMDVLLKGCFYADFQRYKNVIGEIYYNSWFSLYPNYVYVKLRNG